MVLVEQQLLVGAAQLLDLAIRGDLRTRPWLFAVSATIDSFVFVDVHDIAPVWSRHGPMRTRRLLGAAFVAALCIAPPRPSLAETYAYLTVLLVGDGSGSYQTADGQIDCHIVYGFVDPREPCIGQYVLGETVTVHIVAATGSCVHQGIPCYSELSDAIPMQGDVTDPKEFSLLPYTLTVGTSGAGTGNVGSTPSGIDCPSTCTKTFLFGTNVTLTAVPDAGAYFAGWTGACAGKGSGCGLVISGAVSTNAVFGFGTPPPTSGPTVAPTPTRPSATKKPGATGNPPASGVATSVPTPAATPDLSAAVPSALGYPTSTVPGATNGTAGSSDITPIALAILGAGLLIALTVGLVGYALLRRRPAP